LSYQDYGLSTDEEACHYRAMVTANYVAETVGLKATFPQDIPAMAEYSDRDHGVLFDLAAYGLERLLGLEDSRQIFIFKHLLTYLVFFIGLIAFYQLVSRRLRDWRWGLLGAVMLFLSPRLFADAFYNAKDLVFMVTYLIAMNTASALFEKPTLGRTLVHGLATAAAIAIPRHGHCPDPGNGLFSPLAAAKTLHHTRVRGQTDAPNRHVSGSQPGPDHSFLADALE